MTAIDWKPSRRRMLLAGAAAGAAFGFPAILRAQTKELVVSCPTTYGQLLRDNFFNLFEKKYGVKVLVEGAPSSTHLEKLRANRAHPVTSVVLMDDPVMVVADRDGLLDHITAASVPNLVSIPANLVHQGGAFVNYMLPAGTIAYNTTRVPGGVKSWAELWEPRYEGQLLLQPFPQLTQAVFPLIVSASLASGLSFEDALDNKDAMDAGFRKLAQIRPNAMVFSPNTAQLWTLLQQGEASVFVGCPAQIVPSLKQAGAPVEVAQPEEGAFAMPNAICVVKDGPNPNLAAQLVNEFLGDEYQSKVAAVFGANPASPTATVPADFTRLTNLHAPDWTYIADNTSAWADRWAREIAG